MFIWMWKTRLLHTSRHLGKHTQNANLSTLKPQNRDRPPPSCTTTLSHKMSTKLLEIPRAIQTLIANFSPTFFRIQKCLQIESLLIQWQDWSVMLEVVPTTGTHTSCSNNVTDLCEASQILKWNWQHKMYHIGRRYFVPHLLHSH